MKITFDPMITCALFQTKVMPTMDFPSPCPDDLYSRLSSSLPESLARVEDIAMSSLTMVYTPLLPPIFSKQDIITCLHKYKRLCNRLGDKLACLTLLTDYVVSAITYPAMVDIFLLDTTNKSKKFITEILSRDWGALFQAITTSIPMSRPSKEAMESSLSFLRRIFSLLDTFDQRFSSMLLSSVSNNCFWSFGLQSVGGRDARPCKTNLAERIN